MCVCAHFSICINIYIQILYICHICIYNRENLVMNTMPVIHAQFQTKVMLGSPTKERNVILTTRTQ